MGHSTSSRFFGLDGARPVESSGPHRLGVGSASRNKKLLVTSASLLVTSALLVVAMFATRSKEHRY